MKRASTSVNLLVLILITFSCRAYAGPLTVEDFSTAIAVKASYTLESSVTELDFISKMKEVGSTLGYQLNFLQQAGSPYAPTYMGFVKVLSKGLFSAFGHSSAINVQMKPDHKTVTFESKMSGKDGKDTPGADTALANFVKEFGTKYPGKLAEAEK